MKEKENKTRIKLSLFDTAIVQMYLICKLKS